VRTVSGIHLHRMQGKIIKTAISIARSRIRFNITEDSYFSDPRLRNP
jgi:hypothetical protein